MASKPEVNPSVQPQNDPSQDGSQITLGSGDVQQLSQLIEQLAAEAVAVDAEDLTTLASMHSQLLSLQQHAEQLPGQGDAKKIGPIAAETSHLVEQLILRQADDAAACLQHIGQEITQLQQVINSTHGGATATGATDVPSSPAAVQEQQTPPPPAQDKPHALDKAAQPSAEAIPSETVISGDDAPLVAEFVSEATGHIETAEAELLKLEEQPEDPEALNAVFRSFHTIKGVAGFLNLRQIGALAHVAENLLDLARRGELKLCGNAVDLVLEAIDQMKLLIADLDAALRQGRAMATQPDLPSLLERLRACAAGSTVPESKKETTKPVSPKATPDQTKDPKNGAHPNAVGGGVTETTVKVATDRLDNLINMVGELVIAESMVRQDVVSLRSDDQRVARNVSHLNKITRSLQELSMSMRMVPIQGVFQKMARLARDLGRKSMKQVEFSTEGGETELDRNVVEAISDPLVHMVRNSVDHGIESPEDRQKAGKTPAGHVRLRAFHQAGNIVIQISDDGRGLNKQKILKKAIECGIVQPEQSLGEQEIFQLIFHAGLSTADKITDISGRGVGMDVVRKNIEALRGRIEIASTEGQGTTFTIRLPLTLAVIDGLVIKVGQNRYILPMTGIEKSLRPTPEQISTVQGRGEVCHVRGSLLPLFRLHRLFNVKPLTEDPTQALVVIIQDNHRRCCVLVDELLGQQQVVIKALGELVGKVSGVCGGAILGDGNVSMILDIPGLIDLALANGATAA
ncbi:MAG: chemotaxis protein CheA [Bacillota bacterium]